MTYGNGDFGSPGIPFDGTLDIGDRSVKPNNFTLKSLYPNPFNPYLTIQLQINEQANLTIEIFDLHGRKIETLINDLNVIGNHEFTCNANDHPSGMYFFKLTIDGSILMRKALYIK